MAIDGLDSVYVRGNNFRICINIAEKPLKIVETKNQRWDTIYQYGLYGVGKMGDENNHNDYIDLLPGIYDVSRFISCEKIFYECYEPSKIIGFNPLNLNDTWNLREINNQTTTITPSFSSVIFSANGIMFINDKQFLDYNFAYLEKDKSYNLEASTNTKILLFELIS